MRNRPQYADRYWLDTGERVLSLKANLAANLKYLCNQSRSVASVCRNVGINRQQFNKYLNGTTFPSPHTLNRICGYFRIDETEIVLPPSEFLSIVRDSPSPIQHGQLSASDLQSVEKLRRYLGYYHAYYRSPAYPGQVVRSVSNLIESENGNFDHTLERHVTDESNAPDSFVCKYRGPVVLNNDRIYIYHNHSITHDVRSLVVLYPSQRPMIKLLSGVFVSVSGGPGRQPFASRIVYEFLGKDIDLRAAVSLAGVYSSDSEDLPHAVRTRLDNTISDPNGIMMAFDI